MKNKLLFLFLFVSSFCFGQINKFNQGLYIGGNKVYVETTGPVEGVFSLHITLAIADATFSISEISLTNASAENLYTSDNKIWTVNILPTGAGDVTISVPSRSSNVFTVTINTDWKYLTQAATSDLYYEFRELISDHQVNILSTDPSLLDLSGNSINLSLLNSPTTALFLNVADINTDQMGARFTSTQALNTGTTGSSFFSRSSGFSVVFQVRSNDGQSTSTWAICGNRDATNTGLIFDVTTAGLLEIKYQGFVWRSTSAVFVNGVTGLHSFEAHFDFPNNTLTVYKDGSTVAGSFTTGNINTTNPASYACTRNFHIGSYNNDGGPLSNPETHQLTYFAITQLQTSNRAAIYNYLLNRDANLKLVATLTSAEGIKFPHDVKLSPDKRLLAISGKGDDLLTTVDGSFAIADISNPTSPSVPGYYSGQNNQQDGETVLWVNQWRVMHFCKTQVLMFDVSNPKNIRLVKTVTYSGSSVNGAVVSRLNPNYVFGANKGGYIQVFDVTNPDTFTLVGEYNSSGDGLGGCHDIDFTDDGMHIIVANRVTGSVDIGIYQVLNSDGSLISLGSWTLKGALSDATITDSNRARVLRGANAVSAVTVPASGTPYFYTADISNLTAPALLTSFDIIKAGTGLTFYRNRYSICTWTQGLRVFKTDIPSSIVQKAGYFNAFDYTAGNANFHDDDGWEVNGVHYIAVSAQTNNKILIFKLSRL